VKKVLPIIVFIVIVVIFITIGLIKKRQNSGDTTIRIAVIPKGTSTFWQKVRAGAEAAATEINAEAAAGTKVEIFWNGPKRESDRDEQSQIVNDFIVRKVSAIVLAPLDSKALIPSVEKVFDKKIPCIIIDSAIDTEKYDSFIATDNYEGGVIAGRRMGEILNGKGKVVLIKFMAGSASTTKREKGFLGTLKKEFPDIQILETKYGLDTPESALQATEDLLTKHPEFDGLFACNNTTSIGALRALESQGRAGKVKMIGFDSPKLIVDGVKSGIIDSFIIQNPYKMGYLGVKTSLDKIQGKPIERRIDTGVYLITKDNVNKPEIQEMME
jgi:ribose transport system substrate-binding protein